MLHEHRKQGTYISRFGNRLVSELAPERRPIGSIPLRQKNCTLLFRKVAGTTWPPDVLTHRGAVVSLVDIFAEAGIFLHCLWLDDDLASPVGGRSFEPADLRSALCSTLTKYNSMKTAEWAACILIVPEILTVANGRFSRPLGLMFDTTASDSGIKPRQGCAISWRRVQDDDRTYLRTLAHELGHVFNLRHPGEAGEPFAPDAVNTLMVPNQYLRPADRYPDTIEFRFSSADRTWLRYAPDDFVRPGGADYGARPTDWNPT